MLKLLILLTCEIVEIVDIVFVADIVDELLPLPRFTAPACRHLHFLDSTLSTPNFKFSAAFMHLIQKFFFTSL